MKFKLQAGAEFDMLTPKEMREGLESFARDWMVEAAKGPRSIRFSSNGTVDAAGDLLIGGDSGVEVGRVGPDQNMLWSVKRISFVGLADGETVSICIGGLSHVVNPTAGVYSKFGSDELVLLPGDKLAIIGTSLTAAERVLMYGSAFEMPVQQMYRLV